MMMMITTTTRTTSLRRRVVCLFMLLLIGTFLTSCHAGKDKETKAPKTISPMPTISPRPTPNPTVTPAPTTFTATPTQSPSFATATTSSPTEPTIGVPLPQLTIRWETSSRRLRRFRRRTQEEDGDDNTVTEFLHDYFAARYGESFCCLADVVVQNDSSSRSATTTTRVSGQAYFYEQADDIPSADDLSTTLATYLSFMGTHDLEQQAGVRVRSIALNGNIVASPREEQQQISAMSAITNPFVIAGLAIALVAVSGTVALVILRGRRLDAAAADAATAPASTHAPESARVVKQKDTEREEDEDDDDDDMEGEEVEDERVKIPQPSYIRPYGGASVNKEPEDDVPDDAADDSYASDGDIISLASSMKSSQRHGPLFGSSNNKDGSEMNTKWAKSVRK